MSVGRWSGTLWTLVTLLIMGLGCSGVSAQLKAGQDDQADIEVLIQKAKAEGELVLYSSAVENDSRRLIEGFTKAYGIRVTFLRLSSGALQQRFSTEAAAGVFAADFFMSGSGGPFLAEGLKNGWLEPISEFEIPVIKKGQFPERFNRGATVIFGILPWSLAYNTEKVAESDVPKLWTDLLDPRFKDKIGIVDPKSTDSQVEFWATLLEKYGESFFHALKAQGLRISATTVPGAQSLAAGEIGIVLPMVDSAIAPLKAKGAPLAVFAPDFTTGSELYVFMIARKHVKHPNAARLFAHYLLSPEGNRLVNGGQRSASVSVYDAGRLPKEYQPPSPDALLRKDHIYKLLGN